MGSGKVVTGSLCLPRAGAALHTVWPDGHQHSGSQHGRHSNSGLEWLLMEQLSTSGPANERDRKVLQSHRAVSMELGRGACALCWGRVRGRAVAAPTRGLEHLEQGLCSSR